MADGKRNGRGARAFVPGGKSRAAGTWHEVRASATRPRIVRDAAWRPASLKSVADDLLDLLLDLRRDFCGNLLRFHVLRDLLDARCAGDDRADIGIFQNHAMASCPIVQPSSSAMLPSWPT